MPKFSHIFDRKGNITKKCNKKTNTESRGVVSMKKMFIEFYKKKTMKILK